MQLWRNQNPTTFLLASLCCLVSSMDQGLQGGSFGLSPFEFMERIPRSNDFALSKRDVCADAIPGTVTQTCTPGNTLCCVPSNSNATFPQCQQILGKGFCCIEDDDCYIDTVSNCSATNSVRCTLLTVGTTEACCPPFTFCPSNFNQSTGDVRCNIIQSSQTSQTSSSKSSSSSSVALSTTMSPTTSSTTSSISTTRSSLSGSSTILSSLPSSSSALNSKQLSTGTAAGIGIGAVITVLAFIGIGFWAYRRGKRRGDGKATERDAVLSIQLPVGQNQYPPKYHDSAQVEISTEPRYEHGFNHSVHYTRYELPGEGFGGNRL